MNFKVSQISARSLTEFRRGSERAPYLTKLF